MPRWRLNASVRNRRDKTLPIIADLKRRFAGRVIQPYPQMLRVGMALSIMNGFLRNAQNLLLSGGIQSTIGTVDVEASIKPVAACLLHDALQTNRQRGLTRILRAQRPDGLARIREALTHGFARGIELLLCRFKPISAKQFAQHLKLHANADITLREGVMNFARDAAALGQNCAELALRTAQAIAQCKDDKQNKREPKQNIEPDGLIKTRTQLKA